MISNGSGGFSRTNVAIDGKVIVQIGDGRARGTTIDARGNYLFPGLVDLHAHGLGFESAIGGNLSGFARLEASKGATTFYPTLFSPPEAIAETMKRHRRETDELRAVPQVGGFRLESPYIHHSGGGLAGDLAPISDAVSEMLLAAGGGHIKIWDLSPELDGAARTIAKLSESGIVCSLAHTYATIPQAKAAIDAGARLVTHLYNTFENPRETEPGCYPSGLVDYLLVEDRVYCEIIGDGTHVPVHNVEKALRCKGRDRVVFVTDSNLGAGLPNGDYDLPGGWGKARIDGSNNGVRLIDRGMSLSGSALSPIDSFRNIMRLFGKDIDTAVRLCSTNPARLMGLNKGTVEIGKDADLVILDPQLELRYTICAGNVVYESGANVDAPYR
jgi:N-acetylglucosamine-6-phosphate deacetylase